MYHDPRRSQAEHDDFPELRLNCRTEIRTEEVPFSWMLYGRITVSEDYAENLTALHIVWLESLLRAKLSVHGLN